ncbi:MAG: hypothetical protein RBS77_02810 [Candidatus Moranbacteria bacterium]|jgi:predicted  nucleic acid-binding Zn-ribbon protein|nr:hypothetical protein [Candidatus Moranbacteria bacterium]
MADNFDQLKERLHNLEKQCDIVIDEMHKSERELERMKEDIRDIEKIVEDIEE